MSTWNDLPTSEPNLKPQLTFLWNFPSTLTTSSKKLLWKSRIININYTPLLCTKVTQPTKATIIVSLNLRILIIGTSTMMSQLSSLKILSPPSWPLKRLTFFFIRSPNFLKSTKDRRNTLERQLKIHLEKIFMMTFQLILSHVLSPVLKLRKMWKYSTHLKK